MRYFYHAMRHNLFIDVTFKGILIVMAMAMTLSGAIAPDFTVTDTKGNLHHLQSYLDRGKYVLIEFGYIG